jgi:molecular chaperone DnaK (HSP70)
MSTSGPITRCGGCGASIYLSRAPRYCEYCGARVGLRESVLARALRIETQGDVASVLLPRGTILPAGMVEIYSTSLDNQESVGIHLLEGDSDTASQCRNLGWFTLSGISPRPKAVPQIQFSLEVSAEGEVKIEVEELGTSNRTSFRGPKLPVSK